jgi:hypothetical protein
MYTNLKWKEYKRQKLVFPKVPVQVSKLSFLVRFISWIILDGLFGFVDFYFQLQKESIYIFPVAVVVFFYRLGVYKEATPVIEDEEIV